MSPHRSSLYTKPMQEPFPKVSLTGWRFMCLLLEDPSEASPVLLPLDEEPLGYYTDSPRIGRSVGEFRHSFLRLP